MEYGNSSEVFMEDIPEERKDVEQAEQAVISSSVGVIQNVLDWFDQQAAFYGSTDALNIDSGTDPQTIAITVCTAKEVKAKFASKAAEFRSQFAEYLKEDPQG